MLPSERQKKFLELLSTKDVVTISEFISEFNISIETVRRDLSILEKQSKIEKVYGGARLKLISFGEPTMENRMINKLFQKQSIGKKCSEFINDGDCIFIDSGSTTYQIAKFITDKKNLTIITNSIPVLNELIDTKHDIIVIGGKVRRNERSIVSYDYIFNFSQLNIQKSFICAGGITIENGISDYNMQEAVIRKTILERSKEIFVAADSSKFGRDVTINIAPISNVNFIITDSNLAKSMASNFNKYKSNIIIAED
ncbi:DeoR/GlpR family DNA-binding transcription regulator [Clostridium estertheticum]|uniref:DeoR/GlpR family DNA-binding transcription regulator n=1 Tax=Clostridium estertheticum TaxID=238834 RepID=UPI001C7DF49B|nr:DeoR/GlpR family DNA-binding transcription regulator [Clostridium estertheticum]MBX4266892.1 DeoR/GlpR family DNA-binding transcription regulator [Clostridium estertheticum]MBX4271265.1 DeoR/GlpR family DNA-binding transcription regulator [Clostridium estertheticum]WLC78746.1 DeoR/GlpR family DNA-binding transcription regulator [Clostridium estertheticum]WLC89768.1 DeoR/GlpR family DNA-binding transcription regulator [Clostridium estertheticum]